MKIVKSGMQYQLFGNDLETFDELPAKTFNLSFNPMSGYSLIETDTLAVREPKIYGAHTEKQEKIFNSFNRMSRSLGVMMSGDKGIGKTLFTQLLAENAVKRGLPVIIVTNNTPSLSSFLLEIKQEVLILFDEFEKIFDKEDQMKLLSLFDGLNMSKHLYVLTVNELNNVNEFMLNRTGRIHYHLRFDYPTPAEVQLYLEDKLEEQYYPEIRNVMMFSLRMPLNFDLLRAIAFELNSGLTLNEALPDLNILNINANNYDITVKIKDMPTIKSFGHTLDLFQKELRLDLYTGSSGFMDNLDFNVNTEDLQLTGDGFIVTGENINEKNLGVNDMYVDFSSRFYREVTNYAVVVAKRMAGKELNQEEERLEELNSCPIDTKSEAFKNIVDSYDVEENMWKEPSGRDDRFSILKEHVRKNIEYVAIAPSASANSRYNVV